MHSIHGGADHYSQTAPDDRLQSTVRGPYSESLCLCVSPDYEQSINRAKCAACNITVAPHASYHHQHCSHRLECCTGCVHIQIQHSKQSLSTMYLLCNMYECLFKAVTRSLRWQQQQQHTVASGLWWIYSILNPNKKFSRVTNCRILQFRLRHIGVWSAW